MENLLKGAWPRSHYPPLNFENALISLERLKIKTSNFACRLTVGDTKLNNEKLAKSGRGLGHVTYFSILGSPNISGTAKSSNIARGKETDTEQKYAKLLKTGRGLDHVQHLGPVTF